MIRAILAAVLAYVVMVACVMLIIALVWYSLGSQFVFDGDSQQASIRWCLCLLGGGFVAAVAGGMTAMRVGGERGRLACRILIGILVVLGVVSVTMQATSSPIPLPPGKTNQELSFAEAGQYAVSPMWYNIAIVLVGVAGVHTGSRCGDRKKTAA